MSSKTSATYVPRQGMIVKVLGDYYRLTDHTSSAVSPYSVWRGFLLDPETKLPRSFSSVEVPRPFIFLDDECNLEEYSNKTRPQSSVLMVELDRDYSQSELEKIMQTLKMRLHEAKVVSSIP